MVAPQRKSGEMNVFAADNRVLGGGNSSAISNSRQNILNTRQSNMSFRTKYLRMDFVRWELSLIRRR